MQLSFAEKFKLEKNYFIMTYRGKNTAGREYFAYIKCDKDGVEGISRNYENKVSVPDISIYGEVIYYDFRPDPDAKAEEYLEQWLKDNRK